MSAFVARGAFLWNRGMPAKKTVSARVDDRIASEFIASTGPFYAKTGLCFAAALLMWLEAGPEERGAFIKRVFDSEVDNEVEHLLEQARQVHVTRTAEEVAGRGKRPRGDRK